MLDNIIKTTPKQKNIIEAKELLLQAYETTFGIHDYIYQAFAEKSSKDPSNKRPLSSIEYHPNEDVTTDSHLYERIKSFSDRRVNENFGLSLLDFLALPRDIVEHILNICQLRQAVTDNALASISNMKPNDPKNK